MYTVLAIRRKMFLLIARSIAVTIIFVSSPASRVPTSGTTSGRRWLLSATSENSGASSMAWRSNHRATTAPNNLLQRSACPSSGVDHTSIPNTKKEMTMHHKPVALVTGANKGIGLQIAKDLAALGFTVLVG